MREGKWPSSIVWGFMALVLVVSLAGCAKKVVKGPPAPPKPTTEAAAGPAPTIELTVSPGTIEKGQSATLTWRANHAQAVTIEPLGPVASSGSKVVAPETSTTYTGRATAPNRTPAEAMARLTVSTSTASGNPNPSGLDEGTAPWEKAVRDIHFDYDRYEIRPEDQSILRSDAGVFNKYAEAMITVEGHCDERGTEEYNQALGDRRATATKEYLARLGIPASRMTAVSFGKTKPLDPGHSEAAWAKNRRAHFERK